MSIESEVSNWKYSNFLINKKHKFSKSDILSILPKNEIDEAYKIISGWNSYSPTPLFFIKTNPKDLI